MATDPLCPRSTSEIATYRIRLQRFARSFSSLCRRGRRRFDVPLDPGRPDPVLPHVRHRRQNVPGDFGAWPSSSSSRRSLYTRRRTWCDRLAAWQSARAAPDASAGARYAWRRRAVRKATAVFRGKAPCLGNAQTNKHGVEPDGRLPPFTAGIRLTRKRSSGGSGAVEPRLPKSGRWTRRPGPSAITW